MQKLLHLLFGLMAVGVLAASTQMMGTAPSVNAAALDCTETINLKVFIYDDGNPNVNGGLLNLGGAYVDFSDNIQTGGFEAIRYYDNQATGAVRDDNDRRGIIEERTTCRDLDSIGVSVTLGFRENLDCTVIGDATQEVDLYDDTEVSFYVDDCVVVQSATATAVPQTATATPPPATATPAPTVQPVQPPLEITCADGSVKLVPANFTGQVCFAPVQAVPTAPAAPVAPTAPSLVPGRITAPNTGDGGLAAPSMIPCGWEYVEYHVRAKYIRNWAGMYVYVPAHFEWRWEYVC